MPRRLPPFLLNSRRFRSVWLLSAGLALAALIGWGAAAAAGSAHTRGAPAPVGIPGSWSLVFDDEFSGSRLNTRVWNPHDGWLHQNNVTDRARNVRLSDGHAILTLSSGYSGAEIGTRSFGLKVGEYAEARVGFPGRGSAIYNWPAWWVSGPRWPTGGESDIAEGFRELTVSYHSLTGAHGQGSVPGDWGGTLHTYGIYRGNDYCRVYWDGRLVKTYTTDDDGEPETLLLTLGAGRPLVTGSNGAMIVDYVRVWGPAGAVS